MKRIIIYLFLIMGITIIPVVSQAQPPMDEKYLNKAGVVALLASGPDIYSEGFTVYLRINDKSRANRSKKLFVVNTLNRDNNDINYFNVNYEPIRLYVKGNESMSVLNSEGLSMTINNEDDRLKLQFWDSKTGSTVETYHIVYGGVGKTYTEFLVGKNVLGWEFDKDKLFEYIVKMFQNYK